MPKTSSQRPVTARATFWGILIAGLLVVGVGVITLLNTFVYTAEAAVEEYLTALRSGDGATAMAVSQAYLADNVPETMSTVLLDGEALAASTVVLDDAQVMAVDAEVPESFRDASMTQQVVEIQYHVDEEREETTSVVVDQVATTWLFFPVWQLHPMPLQQIELTPTQMPDEARADAPVAHVHDQPTPLLGVSDSPATLAAFAPSVIELEYHGTYLEVPDTERFVVQDVLAAGARTDFTFDVHLTQAVDDAITQEVQEELERCTVQQVLKPAGCPFGYETANRVVADSVSWSIDVPEVQFSWSDSEPSIDWIMATAVLSAQEVDIGTGQQTEVHHEEAFEMTANLNLTPEYIQVRPNWQ